MTEDQVKLFNVISHGPERPGKHYMEVYSYSEIRYTRNANHARRFTQAEIDEMTGSFFQKVDAKKEPRYRHIVEEAEAVSDGEPKPEDRVIAAAKAIHTEVCKRLTLSLPWDKLQNPEQSCYMAYARAALGTIP